MGDENPDFHPKVGDSVWYDYNDDWAEATIVKITGKTFSIDVDGGGRIDKVEKESMLPVEYEEGDDGEEEEEEEEEEEAQEDVEDDLMEVLTGAGLATVSITLAGAGIKTVDDLKGSTDKELKNAGINTASQRKTLLDAVAEPVEVFASNQILVKFPAGPLGIDINMVDGFIVVTSAKGTAADQGVAVNDRLVKVGNVDLSIKLKKTANDQKCAEVKKIVVSLPRPLNMVFEKEGVEAEEKHEEGGKKKKRWSLFGKSKDKHEEKETSLTIDANFVAGPLGLSVTNQPKRNYALCVTKAGGQAQEHGILIDDEIISLNDKDCRGVKSEEFKKLIVAAGRPFKLSVLREDHSDGGDDSATVSSVDPAEEKRLKIAEEKKAIEAVKLKAKQDADKKKQAAVDEKKKKQEDAALAKKVKEEEAAAAKKSKESKGKKEEKKAIEEASKEFKLDQEVWYDNGEDWVEATIVELGETLVVELRESGEEVPDVEREWLAPMEYEDDGEEDKEEEEPEGEEEEEEVSQLASMKISDSEKKVEEAKAKAAAARAKAEAKQAEKKAREAKEAKTLAKVKDAKEAKAAAKAAAKASKGGPQARGGGGFHANRSHMKKFALDKDKAVDHLNRGKAARMSYSAMITFASHHAKKADLMMEEDDDANSHFKKKVRKARSKSLEKRGPQVADGESEYQYLMRKKREEAYDEEVRKEEAREEQARLREEKYFEKEEYRRQLEDEYAPQDEGYDEEYGDEEYDD